MAKIKFYQLVEFQILKDIYENKPFRLLWKFKPNDKDQISPPTQEAIQFMHIFYNHLSSEDFGDIINNGWDGENMKQLWAISNQTYLKYNEIILKILKKNTELSDFSILFFDRAKEEINKLNSDERIEEINEKVKEEKIQDSYAITLSQFESNAVNIDLEYDKLLERIKEETKTEIIFKKPKGLHQKSLF